jgi:hypothetical protein
VSSDTQDFVFLVRKLKLNILLKTGRKCRIFPKIKIDKSNFFILFLRNQ